MEKLVNLQQVDHSGDTPGRSLKESYQQGYGLNDQTLLLVEGIVQRDGNVINILATRIQPLIPNTSLV